MGSDSRPPARDLTLIDDLSRHPYRFDFYMAVRRLDCLFNDAPPTGCSAQAGREHVRFAQPPRLAFAPATLDSFEQDESGRWRLSANFLGLFGPQGALPLHLTEYAFERERNYRDRTFARFVDIFHHRLLSLYYRAWASSQPAVSFDRPERDRFAQYVGSLFGLGMATLRDRDSMPDRAKFYFAGHLACQTRHAEGLEAVLRQFFKIPAQLTEMVPHWLRLPDDCRMRLGTSRDTAAIGLNATLGEQVWDYQNRFRLEFGPMDFDAYQQFLPGGESLQRLIAIVRNYVGDVLSWDIRLILKKAEVPSTVLGQSGQLGWTTWISVGQPNTDADQLILEPEAVHHTRHKD